jgi:hypothetical protein
VSFDRSEAPPHKELVNLLLKFRFRVKVPELSLISYVTPIKKYRTFEPQTGTKSQICSKGKLTSLRLEAKIEKFDIKTKFIKEMKGFIRRRNLISIEWYQKHMCKSSKTIPLK